MRIPPDVHERLVAWRARFGLAIDNALTQYLGAGQTVTAVYRITVDDNSLDLIVDVDNPTEVSDIAKGIHCMLEKRCLVR